MKDDSISFSFEVSVKGQALGDLFKFKESDKIKMTAQECQAKGVPYNRELQYTPWFQNEREINQGLDLRAGNLPECCVQCITCIGQQTRLPMDKGQKPSGVSLYIRDGTGSTSPYQRYLNPRGERQLIVLTTPEHVSSLDL